MKKIVNWLKTKSTKALTIILALLAVLCSSCQTELKLARSFVANNEGTKVAVYFPDSAVVITNHVNQQSPVTSGLLDGFDQNLFLDIMYAAYAKTLTECDLEVYVPDDANEIRVDSAHWLVLLSRVEIEADTVEYEDYLFSDLDDYSYKHNLNRFNVASWFDMNNGEWLPVAFHEHNIIDGFDSKTDYSFWTSKFDYSYTIDTLTLDDLYNYAVYLGKLYAGYTYDYMMNRYVEAKLSKTGFAKQNVFRYDPYRKKVFYIYDEDGFVEIGE